MRKAIVIVLAVCCVFLFACAPAKGPGENLVRNGGFELGRVDEPEGWERGMWLFGEETTRMGLASDGYEGEASAFIENLKPNDARWEQRLSVKPKTWYRFSAMVRAGGCDPLHKGANLSIRDIYGSSADVHDTDGEWTYVELYGRTGDGQKELTLMARLGGYGSENTGKAWFDNVEAWEISSGEVPEGAYILPNLMPQEAALVAATPREPAPPGIGNFFWLAALGLLFVGLILFLGRGKESETLSPAKIPAYPLWIILGGGLIIRLLVMANSPGYGVDVGCFTAWAGRMASVGPWNFYAEGYFCDYPPGYLYVLWINGLLMNLFGVEGNGFVARLILRGLPMLCDLAGAYLLYRLGRKALGQRVALLLAAVYALNPATIITSAAWGQVDSALALGLFAVALLVQRRQWRWALPVYILCVLTKPQALMAGPLGLLALVAQTVRTKEGRLGLLKQAGIGLAIGIGVAAATVVPFWGNQPPNWLYQKYAGTMEYYHYATVNAANLFYLLGGNWKVLAETPLWGISWGAMGIAGLAVALIYTGLVYWRAKREDIVWACAALLFAGVFVMGTQMHERYLLPALLLLGGAYARKRDFRYLIVLAGFSATMLVNVGMVLAFEHLIHPYVWVGQMLAAVNLALLALLAWTVWEDAAGARPRWNGAVMPEPQPERGALRRADALLHPRDHKLRMSRIDWLVMAAITLAYAVIGYWGLGDRQIPQTDWKPVAPDEQVIFDLGEARDFELYYHTGTFADPYNPPSFSIATSIDGEAWSQEYGVDLKLGYSNTWQAYRVLTPYTGEENIEDDEDWDDEWSLEDEVADEEQMGWAGLAGRYVRLTSRRWNLFLLEVAFHNPEGGIWPVASAIAGEGATEESMPPERLIDEQHLVPERFYYMNGTYFDEIYHARTAYEHLHGIHAFEWTHPPLGKLLIMVCIKLFGMTPFGWRFAGATVGVLMLPALYLLAKQLWKRTDLAAFTTLLFALDCMHFTQTRIATIDSYPVLFIMLMYWLMFRYMQMSFYHQKLWKTLMPLALCGTATGLAIASKWIGMYAAVGLALLLFYALYQRFAERRYALSTQDEALRSQTGGFARDTCITLAWCVVWFVAVPFAIYYFSYYIHFLPSGGLNWTRFWTMQKSMLSYHSGDLPHAFQSPWWEWPIIGKPMWYHAGGRPDGMVSTIVAFGNPAVWWGGLAATVAMFAYTASYGLRRLRAGIRGSWLETGRETRRLLFAATLLVTGFASQYLPWVLVPRSTYIYHYFASLPFIILCMGQCALMLFRDDRKLGYWMCGGYLLLTLALFVGYYPFASGAPMPEAWAKAMQWAFRIPY